MRKVALTLLLIPNLLLAQVSDKVLDIVKPLESGNVVRVENWEAEELLLQELENTATSDELYYLALHSESTNVKTTSFKALLNKDDERVFDIFRESLSSKDSVVIRSTCLRSDLSMAHYLYEQFNFGFKGDEKTKESNKVRLVKMILDEPILNLSLLENIHYWIPPDESYYQKLRDIATQYRSEMVLVALARYKKPQDIELIKSFGENAFQAIEVFPDVAFLDLMEEQVAHSNHFLYTFALAKFCDPKAATIMEKAMQKVVASDYEGCGGDCLIPFYHQATMEKCVLFYPVLEPMWTKYKLISYDVYENFKAKHEPAEVRKFLLDGFMADGPALVQSVNMYNANPIESMDAMFGGEQQAVAYLLKELKNYSEEDYEKAVRNCIFQCDNYSLIEFGEALGDEAVLQKSGDVYIEKMTSAEFSYEMLIVMDEVIKLNNKQLFDQGLAVIKKRKKDFKKDNAEDELKAFLNANHLKL